MNTQSSLYHRPHYSLCDSPLVISYEGLTSSTVSKNCMLNFYCCKALEKAFLAFKLYLQTWNTFCYIEPNYETQIV